MRPQIITTIALTNDANGIFQDQTTAGAATLDLNGDLVSGGVAYCYGAALPNAKQGQLLAIEGAGTNAGVIATIVGTFGGGAQTEALTLANAGTATSAKYWTTVESITVDGAVDGNIEGGWLSASTDAAATLAYKLDYTQSPGNVGLGVSLSSGASMTYTVQHTFDMPQDDYGTSSWDADATWLDTSGLTSLTASDNGNYIVPLTGTRLVINAYTSGTAKFTAISGHSPY